MGFATPVIARRLNASTAYAYKCSATLIICADRKLQYLR